MKKILKRASILAGLVLCILGSPRLTFSQRELSKPPQRAESIERPNPSWDYDGQRILGHVCTNVILWDATTGKVLQKLIGHKERIFSVRFSPDGINAFTSSWVTPGEIGYKSKDTRTLLWKLVPGYGNHDDNLQRPDFSFAFPNQVAGEFSPDGKRLLTFSGPRPGNSSSFDAVVWDATKGIKLASSTLDNFSTPECDALHFSPDGHAFAYIMHGRIPLGTSEGKLYDAKDGREIGRSPRKDGHCYNTGAHRYASDGSLVSLERDNVFVTDISSHGIRSIPYGLDYISGGVQGYYPAAWSHDGKRVAAFGLGEMKILDIVSGKTTTKVKTHPSAPTVAIVSPDNSCLAVESGVNAQERPDLRLYEMQTGKEIRRIALLHWGHLIGFSPDSKTILVGGREFIIYDARNGKEIRRLKLLDDVTFSPYWHVL